MSGVLELVSRKRWTLQRFGMSAGKLPYRFFDRGAPKVFCVSIPKAGTHLLERAICLHPRLYRKYLPTVGDGNVSRWGDLDRILSGLRPGQVVVSHLSFRPEFPEMLAKHGVRGIFLIRDPRDTVVSQTHFVSREKQHRQHAVFNAQESLQHRLALSIVGDAANNVRGIGERLDRYAGWLTSGCLVVRFEALVGPGGGGDAVAQEATVRSIYDHLGLGGDERVLRSTCERLFSSDSPTFRKGSIGGWRDAFDEGLEKLFEHEVGDRMTKYGYELPQRAATTSERDAASKKRIVP